MINPHKITEFITGEVLDLGCGNGQFIKEYIEKPEVITVLGLDKEAFEISHPKITVERFNLPSELGINEQSAKFDTVVATGFLEHLGDDLPEMLKKIKFSMKPEALFVGSTSIDQTKLASTLHDYFTDVEVWEGETATLWKAKI